jgi:hypothetical protein
LTYTNTSHLALRALERNKRAVFTVKRERENNLPDLSRTKFYNARAEDHLQREREIRF